MDEVIKLENQLRSALLDGRVPVDQIHAARELLSRAWSGPGKRLDRLREIVAAVTDNE